jgi:hypothetical protein
VRVPSLYASVLPYALGAAVSPTLLTIELLILSGKRHPKARAWSFVLGASLALLAFAALCLTVLRQSPDANGGPVNPWSIVVKGLIVVLLLVLGVRALRPGRTAGEQHQTRVQAMLQSARTPAFVGVGAVAMATNFSTLVLYVPAIHEITRSTVELVTKLGAGLMLFVITVLPLYLPVAAVTVVGHRSDALLAKVNGITTRHSRQISAGICFVFAALVAFSAVREVAG